MNAFWYYELESAWLGLVFTSAALSGALVTLLVARQMLPTVGSRKMPPLPSDAACVHEQWCAHDRSVGHGWLGIGPGGGEDGVCTSHRDHDRPCKSSGSRPPCAVDFRLGSPLPLQQPLLRRTCSDRPATTTDNIHLSYNAKRKPLPLKRTALNRLC